MFKSIARLLRFTRKLQRLHQQSIDYVVYKDKPGHISRGQWKVFTVCKEIFPQCLVVQEHSPAWLSPLRLDVAVLDADKRIIIASEFHGKQHFEYTPHFHATEQDFHDGQARDAEKRCLCKQHNVTMVA